MWRADGEKGRLDRGLECPARVPQRRVSYSDRGEKRKRSPADFGAFQLEQNAASPRMFVGLRPLEGAQS